MKLLTSFGTTLLLITYASLAASLKVLPTSKPLTACGQAQIRWSGSSSTSETDIVILNATTSEPLYIFDQQPAGTHSVTWANINIAGGQVIIQVVDDTCSAAASSPWIINAAKAGQDFCIQSSSSSTELVKVGTAKDDDDDGPWPELIEKCDLTTRLPVNITSSNGDSNSNSSTTTQSGSSDGQQVDSSPVPTESSDQSASNTTSTSSTPSTTSSISESNGARSLTPSWLLLLASLPFVLANSSPADSNMSFLGLPPISSGLLPYWLLLVTALASGNALSNFLDHKIASKVYSSRHGNSQITPLSSRLFATWNLTSAIIRGYAVWNIGNRQVYELTIGSFGLALGHFLLEVGVYKTSLIKSPGVISPLVVSSGSLIWMVSQYGYYVK